MFAQRLCLVVLALWAGSLVTVCALAAPTAFALLERQPAGQVASRLFFAETIIGVVALAIFFAAQRLGGFVVTRTTLVLVVLAAAAPLLSQVALSPMMQAARNAGNMARFGALHGVSALLFVIACVSSVAALWRFTRPAV